MSSDHWELAFPSLKHGNRIFLDIYPEQDRSLEEIIVSGCNTKMKHQIEDKNGRENSTSSDVIDNIQDISNPRPESNNSFSQSTPKKLHSSSDKYRVSLKHENDSFDQNETGNDSFVSKLSENFPKYSSTSSSDLLDKLSLIDVDTIGISSLLSLPSPIKLESDENENGVSIACTNDKSAASKSLVEENKQLHTNSQSSSKSKIPIAVFKQSSFSTESPASSLFSLLSGKESNNLASKVRNHRYFKDKFRCQNSNSSQSISLNDRSRKCSQGNGFRGRRCVSTLSLLDEKVNSDKVRPVANFPREYSQSEEELPKKTRDYRHVESKVKRYIDGIKSLDCSRRASPVRCSTDTPIDDLDISDVFLLDENLVSIEGSESELPKSLSILIKKLNDGNKSPQLMRNILRILINERKLRTEQEQTIASLQLEYDNLLAKHAESKNLLDELRLQSDRGKSSENLTYNPFRGHSCSSTPVHRRYSMGDCLSQRIGKFSSSQPNLIKSTLFEVTHPSLGLSIDKTGDLHFLPSPFESKVSFPLTKTQSTASLIDNSLVNLDGNGSIGKPEKSLQAADIHQDVSKKEDGDHSVTNSHVLDGSRYYVSLGQKLQDFSLLVASDGLDNQEIQIVWKKLLTEFTVLCKSMDGQQTKELASLENAFRLLSKKFCLPFSLPSVRIEELSNQSLIENTSKLNTSVVDFKNHEMNEIRVNCDAAETCRPFSLVDTNFEQNGCDITVDNKFKLSKKSSDTTLKKDVEKEIDVLNIAFNIRDESAKESARNVSDVESGRVVAENSIIGREIKVPMLFNLEYNQKPLSSHEKVEKWRASLQDLANCPRDYSFSNNNRDFQSLVSTERNCIKERKYSSCNNLHLSKRLDVDSGCQVSSGRSNQIKTVLDSNGEPEQTGQSSLHGIASNFSPRSNCSLEIYPSHLKTKGIDSIKITDGDQKFKTDINTSLLRIEKNLNLLKMKLGQTEFNGKGKRRGSFKREPIKVTKDFSFTSGSETESSYSYSFKANHKINSRQYSGEESKKDSAPVLKLCKLQRTKYYSDLENENTKAKSNSTKKIIKRSRSLPRSNNLCRNCHKCNTSVPSTTNVGNNLKEKECRKRLFVEPKCKRCCRCSENYSPKTTTHDPKLITELNSATLLASKLNSKSLEILNSLIKNYGKKRE